MSDVADDRDRQLWAAVLSQAIQDAVAPVSAGNLNKYRDQREALEWLNPDNPDFIEVCWLAGLDPEAVFEGFRRNAGEIELVVLTPENAALEQRRIKREAAEFQRQAAREQKAAEREQKVAEVAQVAEIRSARDLEKQLRDEARKVEKQLRREARETDRKARVAAKTTPNGYHHSAVLYDAFGEQRMLSEWASIIGMPERTIRNRMEAGMSLEDALTAPELAGRPGLRSSTLYTIDGKTRMLSEWAALAGITTRTAGRRINEGWPIEKALLGGAYAKRASTARTYTAFGQTHTAYQWAKLLGMSEGAVAGRLRKGWPIELALTTPTQQRTTGANTTEKEPEIA